MIHQILHKYFIKYHSDQHIKHTNSSTHEYETSGFVGHSTSTSTSPRWDCLLEEPIIFHHMLRMCSNYLILILKQCRKYLRIHLLCPSTLSWPKPEPTSQRGDNDIPRTNFVDHLPCQVVLVGCGRSLSVEWKLMAHWIDGHGPRMCRGTRGTTNGGLLGSAGG
jgi:hypothetical protein